MRMRRWILLLAIGALGCGGGGSGPRGAAALETYIGDVGGAVFRLPVNFATAIRFAPDGRLFFTELTTGKVQVFENGAITTFATLPVSTNGEQGLVGMAFDPNFSSNGWVYFYHTAPGPERGRLVRFTDVAGVGMNETVILDNMPATVVHNGGRIAFGPDGKLYLSTGDNTDAANSQNSAVVSGKILRYNSDGSVPSDNPIPGNPVFALGIRNTFGLAWHPSLGVLYGSDNGPTCDDKINRIVAGGNYGWRPSYPCGDTDPGYSAPLVRINPVIAPTGIAFYGGSVFPEWEGSLLVTSYNDKALRRYALNGGGTAVTGSEVVVSGVSGNLIDVTVGPDGNVYLAGTDAIYRIVRR